MSKKILLVDDDQFMRDVVATKLSSEKYTVSVAATAEEARQKIDEVMPDIVLLDLELPDEHGLDVLRELKNSDPTKNIPVIIFSNNDSLDAKAKAQELGADGFFVKISIDVDDLGRQMDSIFE
jgi:DNA-binding response OmpR family regulator